MSTCNIRSHSGRALSQLFRDIASISIGEEKMMRGIAWERVHNVRLSLRKYGIKIRARSTNKGVYVRRIGFDDTAPPHLKGTTFDRETGKWRAQIIVRKKIKFIGRFETEVAAHAAYLAAKQEMQRASL